MPDPGEPGCLPATVPTPTSPAGGPVPAAARPVVRARLERELAGVRAELARVDTKTGILLGLAGVLLGGALAVLPGAGLSGPAAVAAWSGVAAVAAAVVLLAGAIRPQLDGDFGFVRWAHAGHPVDVLAELADTAGPLVERAGQLRWLSRCLYGKYARIRHAVHLLLGGLAGAAVAAALTAWAR